MKPISRLIVGAALAAGATFFVPLHAGESVRIASLREPAGTVAGFHADQVVVQFKDMADDRDVSRVTREAGAARIRRGRAEKRFLVHLAAGFSVAETLDRLRGRPEVEFAEPNMIFRASQARRVTPNDNFFSFQW